MSDNNSRHCCSPVDGLTRLQFPFSPARNARWLCPACRVAALGCRGYVNQSGYFWGVDEDLVMAICQSPSMSSVAAECTQTEGRYAAARRRAMITTAARPCTGGLRLLVRGRDVSVPHLRALCPASTLASLPIPGTNDTRAGTKGFDSPAAAARDLLRPTFTSRYATE